MTWSKRNENLAMARAGWLRGWQLFVSTYRVQCARSSQSSATSFRKCPSILEMGRVTNPNLEASLNHFGVISTRFSSHDVEADSLVELAPV